jgi:hypothetical protein
MRPCVRGRVTPKNKHPGVETGVFVSHSRYLSRQLRQQRTYAVQDQPHLGGFDRRKLAFEA